MTGITCVLAGQKPAAVQRTAKTVTAYNNAQVDTAQSKFGGASALFDGTGDYLQVAGNNNFSFGTGDYTIEAWVRHNAINDQQVYWDGRNVGSSGGHQIFYLRSDNRLEYFDGTGTYTSTVTMAANTWYHLAVSRSGTSLKIFRDGIEVISATNSANLSQGNTFIFGSSSDPTVNTGNSVNGWMDEIRVSNTARYTTGFTAPTAPFTNDSNTLLLVHCDGTDASTTFTDDTGVRSAKGITAIGNAQVDTAQSKFGGASLLLDGSSDYIKADDSTLAVGTGDFTFECWVRIADTAAFMLFDQTNPTGSNNGFSIWTSFNSLNVYSGGWIVQAQGTINTNTWYHIAVTRDSNDAVRAFIDGTQVGSTQTAASNISQTPLFMGAARIDTTSYDGNGHMDEIRVSKIARYTANFTAPSAAFTNDADTLLLVHCDGTDASTTFTDDTGVRSAKGITAIGNAKISTAQSKFGGASGLFDGTGDYLTGATNDYTLGTGDWTIECWFRYSSLASFATIADFRFNAGSNTMAIYFDSGVLKVHTAGAVRITSASSFSANTWYHVALCRSGTSTRLFLDGVQQGSTYTDSTDYSGNKLAIAANYDFNPVTHWNGYIDEFRISTSARYTGTFTPSSTAFVNDSSTILLLHMNGANNSTTFSDDNS